MLSIKFPFTLSRSHFKRVSKGEIKHSQRKFGTGFPRKGMKEGIKCYCMSLYQEIPSVLG